MVLDSKQIMPRELVDPISSLLSQFQIIKVCSTISYV